MTARRKTNHATDAEIAAWFVSMVEAEQTPNVIEITFEDGSGLKQISFLGRDYDHEQDADRWRWMRDHQAAIEKWLLGREMFARMKDGRPSNTVLIARGQKIAKNGGAK